MAVGAEDGSPDLSVVVVTPGSFQRVRRTVRHLREQEVVGRVELVIVVPSEDGVSDARPDELTGFAGTTVVAVGPIGNVDTAAAHGIWAARAPVVALIEDHAYPQAGWAQAIIAAHRGWHVAVGSVILNANPARMLSWLNLLIAYGPWTDPPTEPGLCGALPGHNITYKRAPLLAYGGALPAKLGRDGGLLDELRAGGHGFFLESRARIAHVNPSLLGVTAGLRFRAGRLYGAGRARREGWPLWRRLLYVGAGPAIPLVRCWRLWRAYFAGGERSELVPRVYPFLLLGLVLDGLGQMAGYLAGAGRAAGQLAVFEMHRMAQITEADRRAISEYSEARCP